MLSIRILPKIHSLYYNFNRTCCSRYSCDLYLYIAIQWEHNSEKGQIQWYFAEEESLNVVQDLFMDKGITEIELIFESPK